MNWSICFDGIQSQKTDKSRCKFCEYEHNSPVVFKMNLKGLIMVLFKVEMKFHFSTEDATTNHGFRSAISASPLL